MLEINISPSHIVIDDQGVKTNSHSCAALLRAAELTVVEQTIDRHSLGLNSISQTGLFPTYLARE